MRKRIIITAWVLVSLTFWGSGLFIIADVVVADNGSSQIEHRSGELLVKFKNDNEVYRLKTTVDADISVLSSRLSHQLEGVEYVEPNFTFAITAFPNDLDLSQQWYLNTINVRALWSKELLTREAERITRQSIIAILDTGVQLDHPDLRSKLWSNPREKRNGIDDDKNGYVDDINGWDFVNNDNNPEPDVSAGGNEDAIKHGTLVAGIAAATVNNGEGIAGVGWFSRIMPVRVLDSNGVGDVLSVVNAIDYAVAQGADVINMSFVGSGYSQSLLAAIKRAHDRGVLVVAAAGNTDPSVNGTDMDITKSYPVCFDDGTEEQLVIGVASVGKSLVKSPFSNYGSCVDIVAPGESFFATQVFAPTISGFEKYYDGFWSGTSLAAPLVSGVLGELKALRPNLTVDQYADSILRSAKSVDSYNPGFQKKLGAGLLDAGQALEIALGKIVPVSQGGVGNYVIAGLGFGSFPQLKILETNGTVFKSFFPYNPLFRGAINVATGDVVGDDTSDIITGAGAGGGPHVRVFNTDGQVLSQFFAYDKNFRGGVWVAVGNVTGDDALEIVTGSGKGMRPLVRVFNGKGALLSEFMAYAPNFMGGVRVAAGDVNRDGVDEIITAPGPGGGPHIRIFTADGRLVSQFFAFNQVFRGGVSVASADLHGDDQDEIIVAGESKSTPTIRVYGSNGGILADFIAFETTSLSGIAVAAGDVDNDGLADIVAGRLNGSPLLRVFNLAGNLKFEFFGHDKNFTGGVRPAVFSL